jgi:hypothetical protein
MMGRLLLGEQAIIYWRSSMKVGDLVRNVINNRVGLVMELEPSNDYDSFFVRWMGDCDWSFHFPEDVEVIGESK